MRQKVVTYVHLIFTLERTRQDVHKLHKFWIQAVQQQKHVVGLMDSVHFLDKGHCVYMDSFYTSPELYVELFFHSKHACRTVHPNRKGLPKAVDNSKTKENRSCSHMQWSTVVYKMMWQKGSHSLDHNTCCCPCGNIQNWCTGEQNSKPLAIVDYIKKMGVVIHQISWYLTTVFCKNL